MVTNGYFANALPSSSTWDTMPRGMLLWCWEESWKWRFSHASLSLSGPRPHLHPFVGPLCCNFHMAITQFCGLNLNVRLPVQTILIELWNYAREIELGAISFPSCYGRDLVISLMVVFLLELTETAMIYFHMTDLVVLHPFIASGKPPFTFPSHRKSLLQEI